jgi:cysteinyl-tRNA synthetase
VSRLSNSAAPDTEPTEKTAATMEELRRAVAETQQAFTAAMDEDFNTPVALAQVFNLVRRANTAIAVFEAEQPGGMPGAANSALAAAAGKITELCAVLGLDVNKIAAARAPRSQDADKLIELLITLRNKARENKHFEYADLIRNGLTEAGYTLEDRAGGTTWKHKT